MTLPLPLRNRLAELILDAFRESPARAALETLDGFCQGRAVAPAALPAGFPEEFFDRRDDRLALKGAYRRFQDEFCERVGRASAVVRDRPLSGPDPSLDQALEHAAALFDARLDFEVHELLEPFWVRAEGSAREALQGLIQIAAGYHHLMNRNIPGARNLLEEGSGKLVGKRLEERDLGAFALAVRRTLDQLGAEASVKFDWSLVPKFPRKG